MKIVLSWLREYAPTDMAADELADLLYAHGVKVEGVERPWAGLEGVIVARVQEVRDHPNSDKLCLARVQTGSGELELVVGVRNMEAGDLVPLAPQGARVPGLPEPLGAREIRGVVSNGMLCSPGELALSDDHGGILVLNDEGLEPGDDLKTALGLDDAVLDIEVEPNRPDFLSVYGVARDVAAITGVELAQPDLAVAETAEGAADVATVELRDTDRCPAYLARVIRGVSGGGGTPLAAQARLTASGMRPITPIVDATNYVMLELGQPLHAFDMSRLAGPGIVVRLAQDGERLTTLDEVERDLTHEDLLICDVERPVAIAGVMGGATAEVSQATRDVLLESAHFTRAGILLSARRLGLHTEASHRFERGVDPEGVGPAAARCAKLLSMWAGGAVSAGAAGTATPPARRRVSMRPARATALLDYDVTTDDAVRVFDTLRMANRVTDGGGVDVEVPGFRFDIEREVDLIEEVARIEGYARVGSVLPGVRQAGGLPPTYAFVRRVKQALARAGLREAWLLPFASEEDLALTGDCEAIEVANPLVADERFMKTRLTPGLLHAVARNQARGVGSVALFEAGRVFRHGDPVEERPKVAVALSGDADRGWSSPARAFDALDAKGVVEALMAELGIQDWELGEAPGRPLHPGRSAFVLIGGERAGLVGEVHPRVAEELDIDGRVAVAEIEVQALMAAADARAFEFLDVPRFPPARRDLAFVVPEHAPAGQVQRAIEESAGDLLGECLLFDVFRGPPLPEGAKSLAFAMSFRAADRTLTDEEVGEAVEAITARVREDFGGELRAG